MNHTSSMIAVDGHLHLYPAYDLKAVFRNVITNLDRLAGNVECAVPGTTGSGTYKLAFLAESREYDFFGRFKNHDESIIDNEIAITSGPDPVCVSVGFRGVGHVCLVAGRQIVTRERLEILGLAMRTKIPDGLPVRDVIQQIAAAGGIPVLAWSPGKWLFARGRLTQALIESDPDRMVRLGDTPLRPTLWPEPRLMRQAREHGRAVIPGSDPLPFAGEERFAGTYGFLYRGAFDTTQPAASISRMLAGPASALIPAGARCGTWAVAQRLYRLRKSRD